MLTTLRQAAQRLAKTPGFAITALATLAICIGANLAIFAVVDGIVLRPLPFPSADRLVLVTNSYPGAGVEQAGVSIPNYFDRRHAIKAFASVSSYEESDVIVGDVGSPNRVRGCARHTGIFRHAGCAARHGSAVHRGGDGVRPGPGGDPDRWILAHVLQGRPVRARPHVLERWAPRRGRRCVATGLPLFVEPRAILSAAGAREPGSCPGHAPRHRADDDRPARAGSDRRRGPGSDECIRRRAGGRRSAGEGRYQYRLSYHRHTAARQLCAHDSTHVGAVAVRRSLPAARRRRQSRQLCS